MDILLSKVTQQAMNYAIRSGVTITATYALKQCGRLLKTVKGYEREELATLQLRLDAKIKIISPAIDMVELIAARGNTSLESAVTLTKSLRWDIQSLGSRVEKAVGEEMLARKGSSRAKSRAQNDIELKIIIAEMKKLLNRIEDAVPLISLAITTSGVNLSTTLPATVSPSRLLQASTFLTSGDMQYCATVPRAQQIGPTFNLSMYMLFAGHTNRPLEEGARETTWKEVIHKARVTLLRVPLSNVNDYPVPFGNNNGYAEESRHCHIPSEGRMHEFAYQLLVVEDFDDGRVHDFDDGEAKPEPYDGIKLAGIREVIPIHQISKIFYADTGKILNIGTEGETNNPILLLKRDIRAEPPRRMLEREHVETGYESDGSHTVGDSEPDEEQTELDDQLRRESTPNLPEEPTPEESHEYPWRLPPTLDLEWMAFEVYTEELTSDSDIDDTEDSSELDVGSPSPADTRDESPGLSSNFSRLDLRPSTPQTPPAHNTQLIPSPQKGAAPVPQYAPKGPTALLAIKTSLSLLEMLIRLTALQQFQQSSHLAINDEYLNFFLSDSSTVGAGGDAELRRQVRRDARMRVGFDPYDESPIRRRGEDYLEHELHDDDNGYGEFSPIQERPFDYDSYPHGKASTIYSPRSRSATPARSPSLPNSTPPQSSGRSKPSADVPLPSREHRPSLANLSSASPLLRRATTQPNQNQYRGMKQPSFRGPPTAPPSSSSPRAGQTEHGAQQPFIRESSAPDTPPDSVGRNG